MSSPTSPEYKSNAKILREALSLSITVGAYGAAFGAAAIAAGFSLLQTSLLSLLLFSGASQFALVGVMGAGGSAISAITTASLLGFRNGLYGLRISSLLNVKGVKKIVAAQITIDESTGVALSQERHGEKAMRYGFWATGFGVYFFWNFFTLLGALSAAAMSDPAAWGLDAAVPAAFLGLVWPRLTSNRIRAIAISAALLASALTPILTPGAPIIATTVIAIIFGWRADRKSDGR